MSCRIPLESSDRFERTNRNSHFLHWQIYTSDTAGVDDISKAVIVETTARTRPIHKWAKSDLDAVVNKNVPVRISGWLLYDYEHVSVIGSQRASVWEIHPITKIEVKRNGQWVNLGQ